MADGRLEVEGDVGGEEPVQLLPELRGHLLLLEGPGQRADAVERSVPLRSVPLPYNAS